MVFFLIIRWVSEHCMHIQKWCMIARWCFLNYKNVLGVDVLYTTICIQDGKYQSGSFLITFKTLDLNTDINLAHILFYFVLILESLECFRERPFASWDRDLLFFLFSNAHVIYVNKPNKSWEIWNPRTFSPTRPL